MNLSSNRVAVNRMTCLGMHDVAQHKSSGVGEHLRLTGSYYKMVFRFPGKLSSYDSGSSARGKLVKTESKLAHDGLKA